MSDQPAAPPATALVVPMVLAVLQYSDEGALYGLGDTETSARNALFEDPEINDHYRDKPSMISYVHLTPSPSGWLGCTNEMD